MARRLWTRLRDNPSAVLLVVQLAGIIIYPFFQSGHAAVIGRTFLSLFGLVILALAILAVRPTPASTIVSLVLGVPVAALTIVDAVTGYAQPWHFVSDALHALFYAYTAISLIRYMFADRRVTPDELAAIVATFTVAVWAFAYVYSIIQAAIPGSFAQPLTWMDLLFLSATTMTNTGLSDIVPVKPNARSVVMVQEIAGVMYLALVVARMVSLESLPGSRSGADDAA